MNGNQNDNQRQRVKTIHAAADNYSKHVKASLDIWSKQLGNLEKSLRTMRDELFQNDDAEAVTVTGQILIANAAERAVKLVKEASGSHKTSHVNCSKIGKNIDRHFVREPVSVFKLDVDMAGQTSQRKHCCSMIYDFIIADGLNDSAETLKQEAELVKYQIEDPVLLKQVVDDLRQGEIGSSLGVIDKLRPTDETNLRKNLQTQMITDCIELDNYSKAVGQMKRFRKGWMEDTEKAPRLLGALLIGRSSMCDERYKNLFDYANREQLTLKMASFFMPNDAPLKMILRYGSRAMMQLFELCKGEVRGSFFIENELPMEVSINPTHSAFTCPILKEQCSSDNPPMRLICGHVISRDAINRLTTSLRQVRNSNRHSRFKCPYCPREQYMDTAKVVDFSKWVPAEDEEEEDMDVVN